MGLHFNAGDDEKIKKFFKLTSGGKQENAKVDSYFEQYAREFGLTKDDLTEAFNVSIWAPSMNNESGGSYKIGTGTDEVGQNQIEDMLSGVRRRKMELGISAESRQTMGDLTRPQSVSQSGSERVSQQQRSINNTFGTAYTEQKAQLDNTKAKGESDVKKAERKFNNKKGKEAANNRAAELEETRANAALNSSQVTGNRRIAEANANADRDNARAKASYTAAQAGLNTAQQTSDAKIATAKKDASDKNTQAQNELTAAQTRQQTATSNIESLQTSISDLDKKIKELSQALDGPDGTEEMQNEYNKAVAEKRNKSEELEKQEKELEEAKQAVTTAQQNVNTVSAQGNAAITAAETEGKTSVAAAQLSFDRALSDMQTTEQRNSQTVAAVTTEVNTEIATNQATVNSARLNTHQIAIKGKKDVDAADTELKKAEDKAEQNNEDEKEKLNQIKSDWNSRLTNIRADSTSGLNNQFQANLGQGLRASDANIPDKLNADSALNADAVTKDERVLFQELNSAKMRESASFRPLGTNPEAKIEKAAENLAEKKNDDLAIKEPDKQKRRTFGV